MEIARLISILEETIGLLQNSRSSDRAAMPVPEVIQALESEISKARDLQPNDEEHLGQLFAPTGPIREIAIENGWRDDFRRISDIVDRLMRER